MMLASMMVLISLLAESGQAELFMKGPENVEVFAGGEAILTCELKHPYKFCSFVNPTGATFPMDPHSEYQDGRISFAGSNDDEKMICGVKLINVTEADAGKWECILTVVRKGMLAENPKSHAIVTVLESPGDIGMEMDQEKLPDVKEMDMEKTGNVTKEDNQDNVASSEMENVEYSITPGAEFDYSSTQASASQIKRDPIPDQMAMSTPLPNTQVNQSFTSTTAGFEEINKLMTNPKSQVEDTEESFGAYDSNLAEVHVPIAVIVIILTVAIILITVIAKIKSKLCFKDLQDVDDAEKCTRETLQNDEKVANEETKTLRNDEKVENEETKSSKSS